MIKSDLRTVFVIWHITAQENPDNYDFIMKTPYCKSQFYSHYLISTYFRGYTMSMQKVYIVYI